MNKRILALLLSAMMVLAAPLALAQMSKEETIAALTEVVKTYINEEEFNFDHDAEDDIFSGTFTLDSSLGQCDVKVFVYDDMVSVSASPSLRVPQENRDKVAIFLTLANYNEYYSQFRMDYEDGYIATRSAQLVEGVIPGTGEIDTLVMMPIITLDEYGNGINKVALMGMDPHEAFAEALRKIEGNATDKSL